MIKASESLTVAIPFFNEKQNLISMPARLDEIEALLDNVKLTFILIDDGSTDESESVIRQWQRSNLIYIRFSKNFGSHMALLAAVDLCESDFFTFMSSDFQEPAGLFKKLLEQIRSGQSDIVFGKRNNRNATLLDRFNSRLYNALTSRFAFKEYPPNGVDVFMVNLSVINILKTLKEKNTSIYGLLFSIGFKKSFVNYEQQARKFGKSKWTFSKKLKLLVDTFVCFTVLPLRMITLLGVLFSAVGLTYGLSVLVLYLNGQITVVGFSTIISIMTFGFGLVFLMIGIISEYLWRIFDEIRPRPRYIIDSIFKGEKLS